MESRPEDTHLPPEITGRPSSSPDTGLPKVDTLAAYELMAIENALKKCDGNRRHAAQMLEIGESTLYRKMKLYDLD